MQAIASSQGPFPPMQGEIWYTLFVHAHNISSFYEIRKIMNTYCTFGVYTNRACSFHGNECECGSELGSEVAASLGKLLFGKALLCATSVVKAVVVLKMEPLQLCTKRDKCVYVYE